MFIVQIYILVVALYIGSVHYMHIIFRQQACKSRSKINIKKNSENAFIKTATSQIVEYFYAKNVIVTTLDISARHSLFEAVSAFVWLQSMF